MGSRTQRTWFEQAPGVGDGQGGLACYSPRGRKELDRTEQLNNNQCLYSVPHMLSLVHLFATPWTAALQASQSITNS